MRKQICGIALVMILTLLSIPAMAADTGNTSEATAQDPEAYQAAHRTTEAAENQIVNPAERVMLFANSTMKSSYTGKHTSFRREKRLRKASTSQNGTERSTGVRSRPQERILRLFVRDTPDMETAVNIRMTPMPQI